MGYQAHAGTYVPGAVRTKQKLGDEPERVDKAEYSPTTPGRVPGARRASAARRSRIVAPADVDVIIL